MFSLLSHRWFRPLATMALGGMLASAPAWSQELDTTDLKPNGPPYDASRYDFASPAPSQPAPATSIKEEGGKVVLSGKIQTLQQAIQSEKGLVDWYAWYLSVREYLSQTGGLNECALGTEIVFYKNGRIEAHSSDPRCRATVMWRRYALPRNTQLDALILPVRRGSDIASPEEIYTRVETQSLQNRD